MTYATQQDLIERFGEQELAQLSDRANGSVIDAAVLGRALADADAEINSYLGRRYVLPLAPVPAVVPRLAADMARYYLYDERVTEAVAQRYKDAVRLLRDMASGAVRLDGGAAQPLETDSSQVPVAVRAPQRVFSATLLDQY